MIRHRNFRKAERGQTLVLCALFMTVLLLFAGLAVDFGMAYLTRAQLGKAVDAEALTAARYSGKGTAAATALAQSAFTMNYSPASFGTSTPPVPVYSTDASGNTVINVSANATTNTFFARMLPGFRTLTVNQSATSMARRVVMTLVLDRTGSMGPDGGSVALPGAVTSFIEYFNDATDTVAAISFAEDVTVDVPMTTGNFQTPIINDVNAMSFGGGTYSDGGLQRALSTETGFAVPAGMNLEKVVVFFTDGNANSINSAVTCTSGGLPSGTYNVGGYDDGYDIAYFVSGTNNTAGPTNSCNGTFTTLAGTQLPLTWANVSGTGGDARARVLADANAMRAAGITVYAVGLGSAVYAVNPTFLCEVANDSCGGTNPMYNSAALSGVMAWAPTAAQLAQAFQTVASVIRLRLVQ